jgi:hypothetical protein
MELGWQQTAHRDPRPKGQESGPGQPRQTLSCAGEVQTQRRQVRAGGTVSGECKPAWAMRVSEFYVWFNFRHGADLLSSSPS